MAIDFQQARRPIRFWLQRRFRGWDSETWNLDFEFGKWVLPRVRRFKELERGYPKGLTEQEWNGILDQMIAGFALVAGDSYWLLSPDDEAVVNNAFALFGKWGRALWS
jgi:hypothetical protein